MSWLRALLGRRRTRVEAEPATGDPERIADVQRILERLRPAFRADGGDILLVRIEGGRVFVRLQGACSSCAASTLTLRGAIQPLLAELSWFEGLREV